MDTFMYVKVNNASSQIMRDVKMRIYDIEKRFGKNVEQSDIRKVNLSEKGLSVSAECATLLERAFEISKATDNAFNPCLGSLIELWDGCKRENILPYKADVERLIPCCDVDLFTLDGLTVLKSSELAKLDLGGIAKGYAAMQAIQLLRENGVTDAMLNLGGNIAVIGESEKNEGLGVWSIGIKNPFDTDDIVGILNASDCFISVSGAYERFFNVDDERYHHILDSSTGYPAKSDIESVAVVTDDGTLADALSTALFVMGFDDALDFYENGPYHFEAVFVLADGSVYVTQGLRDSFTLNESATGISNMIE